MLRKVFVVEVQNDRILVRVTGTSYFVSYHKPTDSPQLLPNNLPLRDDHRAPMGRLEFIASAWRLANDKARELGWIGKTRASGTLADAP